MASKVQKARLALAERVLKEGMMTGASPTRTGAMAGRYMRHLKQSVEAGQTDPSLIDAKRKQYQRIQRKVAARQNDLAAKAGYDPAATYDASMERFGKFYRRGQRHQDPAKRDPEHERAPKGSVPTYAQRAFAGIHPYGKATDKQWRP